MSTSSHGSTTIHARRRPATSSLALVFDIHPIKTTTSPTATPFYAFTSPRPSLISHRRSSSTPAFIFDTPPSPDKGEMQVYAQFPPTPSPSINSESRRTSELKAAEFGSRMFSEEQPEAGPSSDIRADFPPTPPTHSDDEDAEHRQQHPYDIRNGDALAFEEPVVPQRVKKGRRPLSVYPATDDYAFPRQGIHHRKYTDPSAAARDAITNSHQQLDVDLDAYSATDFDETREPTLSFVTTSTDISTTGTPPPIAQYDYKGDLGGKGIIEPRIRIRTTAGRANAYSSAESSMASGAYSYHAYADNNLYHPLPPPLPVVPSAFAEQVGLGITADDIVIPPNHRDSQVVSSPSSSRPPISPTTSFAHRPWKRDVINRLRSDSVSSSFTTASASTTDSAPSGPAGSASSHIAYPFGAYAQAAWEREDQEAPQTPEAVALVDKGKERIFNVASLNAIGGIEGMTQSFIESLEGVTHLLLPNVGSSIIDVLEPILLAVSPTLVVLDLSGNYLSYIPTSLQNCTALEELNLAENPLRHLPGWMGELISLRMLVIDSCGLQNLPFELSMLSRLHTLCARRNRLVSLPSWLCLLNQLETLKIDDNPFAAEWQPIVAPILAQSLSRPATAAFIPQRSSSMRSIHSLSLNPQPSMSSMSSSRTIESGSRDDQTPASASSFGSEGWSSVPGSAMQSTYQLNGLGSIAEDQANTPTLTISPTSALEAQPKTLRKMRSAGDLLSNTPQSSTISPIMNAFGINLNARQPQDTATLVPPPTNRFASLGSDAGRRAISVMGSYDETPSPGSSSRLTASSSSKTGKWGFLRKMSMHRLKSSDKNNASSLASSASANLKTMPPPLVHAHSDDGPAPIRPIMSVSRSAMTLPVRKTGITEATEFGQSTLTPSSSTMPMSAGLPSSSSPLAKANSGVKKGRPRSFLPVDEVPSINISIPSTSPFMQSTALFEDHHSAISTMSSLPPVDSVETLADTSMTVSGSQPVLRDSAISNAETEARYATGLESIKSYLKDLFDLSRPPIEPYGGFAVVESSNNGGSTYAASTTPSAEPTSPMSRLSISEARRARRPTLEAEMSRDTSSASITDSERCSFAETVESSSGKKFKNDKGKRARVILEIYETEKTYVRGLGELVSIYVKPASQLVNPGQKGSSETVVPAPERKVVFGGVESILTIHRDNLLPALERAVRPLIEGADDDEGELSTATAHAVGEVFRTYIAYMKQYSSYINNFDNAATRMKSWSAVPTSGPSTPSFGSKPSTPTISSAAVSVGVGLGAVSLSPGDPVPHSGCQMTTGQRKRVKQFLKKCREHPMHSQISLESYLLLPIQRVPRYKLLLEDLAMCTAPKPEGPKDTLDDALEEIASLASLMNEEKRDADSRLRLYHWQQRISSRGPSPLVQPHRRLIMDGALTLIRLVKKSSSFVEVDNTANSALGDGEHTITPSKIVVPVEHIAPEPMDRPMMLILCTDLLVLVQQQPGQTSWDGQVDLFNVLRMATLREPASIVHGNVVRVVDNKSIYYFNGGSNESSLNWCRAINTARRR